MTDVPPTSESRLDALVGALRASEPTLDEVTRARIGADLASTLRNPAPPSASLLSRIVSAPARWLSPSASGSTRHRWLVGGFALAATAVVVVVVVRPSSNSPARTAAVDTSPSAVDTSPSAAGSPSAVPSTAGSPSAIGTSPSATSASPVLPPGHAVDVAAGLTARVAIADADITIYGPGRVETTRAPTSASAGSSAPVAALATVDADAATIDRSHGDGTLALRYATLEVHVTHATFAFDRKRTPRVTVMRGDLLLRCPDSDRTIHAGESASCTDAPSTVTASLPDPSVARASASVAAPSTSAAAHGAPSLVGDLGGDPVGRTVAAAPRRTSGSRTARVASAPGADLGGHPLAPAAEPTPTDLYATADAALRRGDRDAARTTLEQIVSTQPTSTDAAAALLDLARLDAASDPGIALRRLDTLDVHPRGAALAEPAAHLRCTMLDGAAHLDCLASFIERFPHSPRTAAALARLATTRASSDCAAAAPLLAAYLTRFPRGADVSAVTAWRDRCTSPR